MNDCVLLCIASVSPPLRKRDGEKDFAAEQKFPEISAAFCLRSLYRQRPFLLVVDEILPTEPNAVYRSFISEPGLRCSI